MNFVIFHKFLHEYKYIWIIAKDEFKDELQGLLIASTPPP